MVRVIVGLAVVVAAGCGRDREPARSDAAALVDAVAANDRLADVPPEARPPTNDAADASLVDAASPDGAVESRAETAASVDAAPRDTAAPDAGGREGGDTSVVGAADGPAA